MNGRDVAAVLGILAAAWPNQAITEQTAAVWGDALDRIDAGDAMQAARALIRREHWFPSVAQFCIEAEAQAHARRNREASERGLPATGHQPAPPSPGLLDATRQLLADQRSKKHWHGGPQPCPVCGGMRS